MKGQFGFTLVELLISVTIVALLSSVAVANFRVVERRQELKLVADTLAGDLKRAQTMSLIGAKLPDGKIARGGFSILLEPVAGTSPCSAGSACYVLFAEKPFTGAPPALSSINGRRDGVIGTDYQDVSVVNLSSQISMTILEGVTPSAVRSISFAPPRPITCFATSSGLGVTTTTVGSPAETIFACVSTQPNQVIIRFTRTGISGQRDVIVDQRTGSVSVQ
jgi:prepilin-type N-terminal cleavage/methylation domain-containing protein